MEMNKIKKEYLVNVDMRWEKFKKNLPKKCFEILADKK